MALPPAPLVALGCIMMRVCHLDTCPVGVATQNPELRKKFTGDPQHVVNFMYFMAQELREIMAQLGFRTVNEMIGRVDRLEPRKAIDHWKAKGLDFSNILYMPDVPGQCGPLLPDSAGPRPGEGAGQPTLLELCKPALEQGKRVAATLPIRNTNRVVGTILGSEITPALRRGRSARRHDRAALPGVGGPELWRLHPQGLTLELEGDANDYFGKGLSGGKIIVYPPAGSTFPAEENIIIGNVAFYGATAGEAYIRGVAGERFCVRNSGVHAVVEGVGDHGCEYMTAAAWSCWAAPGATLRAGMSGGIAYVLDEDGTFANRCNTKWSTWNGWTTPTRSKKCAAMIQRHLRIHGQPGRRAHAGRLARRCGRSSSR